MCDIRKAVVIPVSLTEKPYVIDLKDHYTAYYPVIGCRAFDVVVLLEDFSYSVDCFINDEGMLDGSPVNKYWVRAYQQGLIEYPLYGICVVTMSDPETGDSMETDLNLVKKALRLYGFTKEELDNIK